MAHSQPTVTPPQPSKGSYDSDVEYVSSEAGEQTRFNPLSPAVAQFLREKVEERSSRTATRGLGTPCKISKTLGDGNCFFRAISKAVYGSEELHIPIRNAVVRQLQTYAPAYNNIVRSKFESVSEYIRKSGIHKPGSWATEVEIQVAADFFNINIYMFYSGHWIQYIPKGGWVSDQGIYLENSGCHYNNVVCVKRPETQSCYNYCRMDLNSESMAHVGLVEEIDEEDCAFNRYRGEEEDEIEVNLSEEGDDYESQGDLPEEDTRWKEKLSWSVLNRSWGACLDWLGEHWWSRGSKDEIMSFMDDRERRTGDIVVSAPLTDTPGAVCAITLKTLTSTRTTDVTIYGAFFICTKLIRGKFSNLVDVINCLVGKMKFEYFNLQRSPMLMSCNPEEFSGMHVAEELKDMMMNMSHIYWGSYESDESAQYLDMLHRCTLVKNKLNDSTCRVCVITRCRSDLSLGYLFEVVSDQGGKIRVTFDRRGFAIGSASRFHEITDLLSYLNKNQNVVFLKVPRAWDATS